MNMITMIMIMRMMMIIAMRITVTTLLHQAPLVHLEKLLFWNLGLAKLPPVRRLIKTE